MPTISSKSSKLDGLRQTLGTVFSDKLIQRLAERLDAATLMMLAVELVNHQTFKEE